MTTKADIDISEALDFILDAYHNKTPLKYNDKNIEILMDNNYKFNVKTYKTNQKIIVSITHYQKL
jgi:hypothetical protein